MWPLGPQGVDLAGLQPSCEEMLTEPDEELAGVLDSDTGLGGTLMAHVENDEGNAALGNPRQPPSKLEELKRREELVER
jgi:hypothetical protein